MTDDATPPPTDALRPATPERYRYARIIDVGTKVSLVLLVVTFGVYVTGVVPSGVPRSEVVAHWHEPAETLAETTGSTSGWAWLTDIGRGDHLPFLGLALLGVLTIVGYASLVPVYVLKRRRVYLVIVLIQIAVLVFAAANVLGGLGGH